MLFRLLLTLVLHKLAVAELTKKRIDTVHHISMQIVSPTKRKATYKNNRIRSNDVMDAKNHTIYNVVSTKKTGPTPDQLALLDKVSTHFDCIRVNYIFFIYSC